MKILSLFSGVALLMLGVASSAPTLTFRSRARPTTSAELPQLRQAARRVQARRWLMRAPAQPH
jgi:hypothetical protein